MSDTLALDSLEIKNFRAFKHLRIERLARVNLIVGKNNVGKTSLLEALWIYAEGGSRLALRRLLLSRDEADETDLNDSSESRVEAFNRLFYSGYSNHNSSKPDHNGFTPAPITISPLNDNLSPLTLDIDWITTDSVYGSPVMIYPTNNKFIRANGLNENDIRSLWDNVTLTPKEDSVIEALQIVHPSLKQINLLDAPRNAARRIAKARVESSSIALPLRSLGEGMSRMFGLALAMVNTEDGLLLVDEIDTGLHYSVLTKMWRLVFETARRLNVQVFATTHSWDCIQAFQAAAEGEFDKDAMLISLRANPQDTGEVAAVLFDNERLKHVAQDSIEVR
jgi:AAA15 family ATPase/GTPase